LFEMARNLSGQVFEIVAGRTVDSVILKRIKICQVRYSVITGVAPESCSGLCPGSNLMIIGRTLSGAKRLLVHFFSVN